MPNEKLHMDFMVIMSEMSVMYYVHYITRKLYSFESHCLKVTNAMEDPIKYKSEVNSTSYQNLILFLMMELETQYGLVGGRATKIIVDFYTNRFWVGIYNAQIKVNKSLFPDGYYKKLKKGI